MLYPRVTKEGNLVHDDQLVGVKEHLSREKRVLFLSGAMGGDMEAHNTLLALESINKNPIKLIITSPGGDLDSAFLLYDTMRLLSCSVVTLGRYCASATVLLLAAGEKRYLMPHAKVMLHLPMGQSFGDARDWDIQHREMKKYEMKMAEILIECGVKKSCDEILHDIDRELWLEPHEVIEYGLADEVIDKKTLGGWLK